MIYYLSQLPEPPGDRYESGNEVAHFRFKSSRLAIMATANHAEDFIDGGVRGEGAVKDVELPLETLWNIITSSAWLDHGRHKLKEMETK